MKEDARFKYIYKDILQAVEGISEAAFTAGYDAGFESTGEGWNAEWPFGARRGPNREETERYARERLHAVLAYLTVDPT